MEQQWPSNGEIELLNGAGEGDFSNFLDLDLDQDFPIFNNTDRAEHQQNIHDVLDPQLMQSAPTTQSMHHVLGQSAHDAAPTTFADENGNAIFAMHGGSSYSQMRQQQQQTQFQHQQHQHHGGVPPTPNSSKMHSDPQRYLQQMDAQARAVYEQQYQMRKGEMVRQGPAPIDLQLTTCR